MTELERECLSGGASLVHTREYRRQQSHQHTHPGLVTLRIQSQGMTETLPSGAVLPHFAQQGAAIAERFDVVRLQGQRLVASHNRFRMPSQVAQRARTVVMDLRTVRSHRKRTITAGQSLRRAPRFPQRIRPITKYFRVLRTQPRGTLIDG